MKTHRSAVVLIPAAAAWEPIQAIRRVHDRKVDRWMPHVTLLYPFRPEEEFAGLEGALRAACAGIEPFAVRLAELCLFRRRGGSATLWLAPEPAEPLVRLQAALEAAFPECDDLRRAHGGLTPHLSVGQARGRGADKLREVIAAAWKPLEFTAGSVSLVARGDPPDDVFRVAREIPLGADLVERDFELR